MRGIQAVRALFGQRHLAYVDRADHEIWLFLSRGPIWSKWMIHCHLAAMFSLTVSQTTDFRRFQTEKVCRRQFQM